MEVSDQRAKAQKVATPAKSCDHPHRYRRDVGVVSKTLTGCRVGEMHLDGGQGHPGESVSEGHTRVRQASRVDEDAFGLPQQRADVVEDLSFVVRLKTREVHLQLRGQLPETGVDLGKRHRPIHGDFPLPQQLQIGAMNDADP